MAEAGISPEVVLAGAARDVAAANHHFPEHADLAGLMTVRHARIPQHRADS